jgi:hypothetical protein
LVLGDSLTWGAGLDVTERFSNLLADELRRTLPGLHSEVLNLGMEGGPTVVERDLLYRFGAQLEPDRIVIGYCLNDPQPRAQNYSVEREVFECDFAYLFGATDLVGKVWRHLGSALKSSVFKEWQQAHSRTM